MSWASAANALGLSTQVSRQPTIAVVGRPPKGLHGVKFTSRSNPQRIMLNQLEATLLEALRDFADHSELDWPAARARIRRLVGDAVSTSRSSLRSRQPNAADRGWDQQGTPDSG